MKINIKKRSASILLFLSNFIVTVFLIFGTQSTIFGDYTYDFFSGVANQALKNSYKNVIFSYSKEKNNNKFIDDYYKFRHNGVTPTKHKSLLLSPSDNNRIVFGEKGYPATVIIQDKLYSYESEGGNYKFGSANLFYYGAPFDNGSAMKNISVSKTVADKLTDASGADSYKSLVGTVVDFEYLNSKQETITEKMYIRGVLMSEKGEMPKYEKLYGEDIVLFYPTYFEFYETQAHFYFTQSAKSNQDNYKLISEFEFGNSVAIKESSSGTKNIELLQKEYDKFVNSKTNRSFQIIFTVIYLLLVFTILFFNGVIISKYKNSNSIFLITAFFILFINEFTTIFLSLRGDVEFQGFNNPARGAAILLYIILLFSVVWILKLNRGKNEKVL